MSITITIANNREYCQEHNLGKRQDDECMCVGGDDCVPNAECSYCHGKGILTTMVRPFEMNVADVNFVMMWRQLGLQDQAEPMGQFSPHKILACYERDGKPFFFNVKELINICNEAMKRGEMVTWG